MCEVGDEEFKGKTKVWTKEWKGGEIVYREEQDCQEEPVCAMRGAEDRTLVLNLKAHADVE